MLFVVCILSLAAFSQMPAIEPGVSLELAKWRAARYSDVRYKLNLTLEKMSPVLKGSMEIRVNLSAGTQEPSSAIPATRRHFADHPRLAKDQGTRRELDDLQRQSQRSWSSARLSRSVPQLATMATECTSPRQRHLTMRTMNISSSATAWSRAKTSSSSISLRRY